MKTLCLRLFAAFLSFIICHSSYSQLPAYLPSNGLVGWWPFNGNANDESGNGNHGVVNGATIFADRFGNPNASFLFDGIDDNIIVQNSSSLETSHWSINAWFKTSSLEFNRITSKDDPSNSYNDLSLIVLNGNLFISTSINGQTNSILPICQNFVADNSWHHVIASRANGTYLIYLDGEICSSVSDYFPEFSTPNPLYIGSPSPYPSQHFNGQLDDIAIYNRALTESEITALYTATATNTGGGTTSTSTAPPGIPYQAEVRNDSGEVLANANVNVRFTLHELTANGAVSYRETHALTTNDLGLFAATIGGGTATQGTFAGINWSQTTKFLQVEVDTGNGYITMGNQQLMSVPYALYAANGPAGPQGIPGPQGVPGPQGPPGPEGHGNFNHYIGEFAEGGIIATLWKDQNGEEHGLVLSLNDVSAGYVYDNITASLQSCCNSLDNGYANSLALVNSSIPGVNYGAIQLCWNYSSNGYSDWYLPSMYEFKSIYNSGFILNSYLSNDQDLAPVYYWVNYQLNNGAGLAIYLLDGSTTMIPSGNNLRVRAVRKF